MKVVYPKAQDNINMEQDIFLIALLDLLTQFIERQRLPVAALRQLRPDLLMLMEKAPLLEIFAAIEKYRGTPQAGFWGENKEWDYYIHGGGCRLIHITTGEPIEHDGPDPQDFDRYWFANWLKWFLETHKDDEKAKIISQSLVEIGAEDMAAALLPAFDNLEQAGKILCLSPHKNWYRLIRE